MIGWWWWEADGRGRVAGDASSGNMLRSTFALPAAPAAGSAKAYICGLGYFQLYINGARVSVDALAGAWTLWPTRVLYYTCARMRELTREWVFAGVLVKYCGSCCVFYTYHKYNFVCVLFVFIARACMRVPRVRACTPVAARYDVSSVLVGGANAVGVMLGNGWRDTNAFPVLPQAGGVPGAASDPWR